MDKVSILIFQELNIVSALKGDQESGISYLPAIIIMSIITIIIICSGTNFLLSKSTHNTELEISKSFSNENNLRHS